jgi:HEAT repeat protein
MRTAAAILALLLACAAARAGEPEFQGKPSSWWGKQLSTSAESPGWARATIALTRGGADAVPVLVDRFLDVNGGWMDTSVYGILQGLAINDSAAAGRMLEVLPFDGHTFQYRQGRALLELIAVAQPSLAKEVLTRLIDAFRSKPEAAMWSATARLLLRLADDSPECIRDILDLYLDHRLDLGVKEYLDGRGEALAPEVARILKSRDRDRSFALLMLLQSLEAPDRELFPALFIFAEEPKNELRDYTLEILLGWCDRAGTEPAGRRFLFRRTEGKPFLRRKVALTMEVDAKKDPGYVAWAREVLAAADLDPEIRATLIRHARHLDPERAILLLPELLDGLSRPNPRVRQACAEVIGSIGPAALEAWPLLVDGIRGEKIPVARACAAALARIGPEGFAKLAGLLASERPLIRAAAAYGLGFAFGESRATAVTLLTKSLADEDEYVRCEAARALGRFGEEAAPALPELVRRLGGEDDDTFRAAVAVALGEIGSRAREAILALERAGESKDDGLASAAKEALAKIRRR